MGDYDKIIKENIEVILTALDKKLLGFEIKNPETITEKLQTTIERETDVLKKITLDSGEQVILHIEFQSTDEPDMVFRMAEYRAILQRKYHLPVRQYVIYLGSGKPKMSTILPEPLQIKGFELKNIHDIPITEVLQSQIPEEITLAILTDYMGIDTQKTIAAIIKRLKQISANEAEFKKSLQQLRTLSRIRKLDEETEKQIKAMPITYDITTDYLYNKGIEKGIEKEKRNMVLNLLRETSMTLEQIAKVTGVTVETVLEVQKSIKN